MITVPIKRLVSLAVICGLLTVPLALAGQAAAQSSTSATERLSKEVDDLSNELNETRHFGELLLTPIALLVSILAAGGVLGVVFSFRDQRRVSQLHELTVSGEISSQRRSEQSYGSFLEQSQTTLSLVNDTLELAKEATDRAAHSMELKAQSRVDAIEERAQKLMLEVFSAREFELIIDDPSRRGELHSVADELRSLEGYLSLQDIKLPQYTKFVKALDQFLLDDTESALQALRLASQDDVVGDLQRFTEYWLGYMLTTVGEYEEAVNRFEHDEISLKEGDTEYFQLERIIAETEFFRIAKPKLKSGPSDDSAKDERSPSKRFEVVAELLDELTKLALNIDGSEDERAKVHTILEVARTRADIYEWIAYDPRHLDDPLEKEPIERAQGIASISTKAEGAVAFTSSSDWEKLSDPDDPDRFRAWALRQAQAICEDHPQRNFYVDFALAECLFKLRDFHRADSAFEKAEHAVHEEFGEHREKRKTASLHQSLLICHSRLLKLRDSDDDRRRAETRQVRQAFRNTREALSDLRQSRVTVFSQIQRRNVTQDEFKTEIAEIVEQDHLKPEDT